ncbi:Uncharacterized protein APZ42_012014 [Daphnia magna]|uniref:Uncharacterized protein n=1 Tax=Daphnia magna TaxID=35525 RepID=A0A162SAP2_9CRUS|nr:Uncharacterized protein APZ42_012014 [Daphnia magna]
MTKMAAENNHRASIATAGCCTVTVVKTSKFAGETMHFHLHRSIYGHRIIQVFFFILYQQLFPPLFL